jgi:hypothetical protein
VDGIEHATFMTADGVNAPENVIRAIIERRIAVGSTVGREPGQQLADLIATAAAQHLLLCRPDR